jgi:hypothetical protein
MADKNNHHIISRWRQIWPNQLKEWDKAERTGGIGILTWEDGKISVGAGKAQMGLPWASSPVFSGGVTLIEAPGWRGGRRGRARSSIRALG